MNPILYSPTETNFTTRGLGTLSDCISAYVEEERNGKYELTIKYPADGAHFSSIAHSCIIKALPYENASPQLFRVYKITAPLNKVCTIYAEHISYQLNYIPVLPFTAYDVQSAFIALAGNVAETCPFTFWTDISSAAVYQQTEPECVRARLGGQEGSFLDVYGGEYEWDNYTVKLHRNRGQDRDVTLRYGKNITDISQEMSIASCFTGVTPFWAGQTIDNDAKASIQEQITALQASLSTLSNQIDAQQVLVNNAKTAWNNAVNKYGKNSPQAKKKKKVKQNRTKVLNGLKAQQASMELELERLQEELSSVEGTKIDALVTLPEVTLYADDADSFPYNRVRTLDLSQEFQEMPSVTDLRTAAQAWMDNNGIGEPKISLKISFVALWDTEEYKDVAPLQRVRLCDTVMVQFENLGISVAAKVQKYKFDVLMERYDSMVLGDAKQPSLASKIVDDNKYIASTLSKVPTPSSVQSQIDAIQQLIRGGYGGYVYMSKNANGQPEEIFLLDEPSLAEARKVLRMNYQGIAGTDDGYEGTYDLAITTDGRIVASQILVGILGDAAGKNYWNMETGEFKLTAANTAIGNQTLEQYVEGHSTQLNQQNVFNALTNNQQNQGIYLSGTDLYINASMINAGTLSGITVISQDSGGDQVVIDSGTIKFKSGGSQFAYINSYVSSYSQLNIWCDEVINIRCLQQLVLSGGILTQLLGRQVDVKSVSHGVDGDVGEINLTAGTAINLETSYTGSQQGVRSRTIRAKTIGGSGVNVLVGQGGFIGISSSSKRWKFDIKPITNADLDPHKILDIPVVQFKFKPDFDDEEGERYLKDVPGLIAEDVDEHYPIAADHSTDEDGNVQCDNWNERYLIPPMLALIQEQDKRIKALEEKIAKLESKA